MAGAWGAAATPFGGTSVATLTVSGGASVGSLTSTGAVSGASFTTAGAISCASLTCTGAATLGPTTWPQGNAAGQVSNRFGLTTGEGLEVTVIDEDVDLTTPAASFDLTSDVPSGAVIESVQVNLETAITGATGATAVGIGIASTEDKYGETAALTKNSKVNTLPDYVVLSGAEDIQLFATDGAGTPTGTVGGAGETIRVRIVFRTTNALDDAP